MRTHHLAALAVVSLLTVGGCSDDSNVSTGSTSEAVTVASLNGKSFVSTAVTGQTLVPGSQITMAFDNGTLRANAGCNSMGGPYTITNSVLNAGEEFGSTAMGCDTDLMAQDEWLAGFLGAAPTLSLDVDALTMTAKGATLTMSPAAVTPNRPLVGTTWTLDTMTDGQTASSVPADVEAPTLRIESDGQAAVTTGCNTGVASVVVNESTMTFGPMRLTNMACKGEPQAVEAAVLAVLDGEVPFAIDGAQLTLTNGGQGLVYRAA